MTSKINDNQNHSKSDITHFGLRIDIDTIKGLTEGVPQILDILEETEIHATFFVTTGPDRTGRNLFQLNKRKTSSFKMNPLRRYGLKQILYGLLLPAPLMELHQNIIKEIARKGHEVGLHGYDHYRWANYLPQMSVKEITSCLNTGIQILSLITGKRPNGFASPAFKWSSNSLKVQNKFKFNYSSDMHGETVFYPQIGSKILKILQIPVTQPSIEELEGKGISNSNIVKYYSIQIRNQTFVTLYIHAGYEGIFKKGLLRRILNESHRMEHVIPLTFKKLAESLTTSAKVRKII